VTGHPSHATEMKSHEEEAKGKRSSPAVRAPHYTSSDKSRGTPRKEKRRMYELEIPSYMGGGGKKRKRSERRLTKFEVEGNRKREAGTKGPSAEVRGAKEAPPFIIEVQLHLSGMKHYIISRCKQPVRTPTGGMEPRRKKKTVPQRGI